MITFSTNDRAIKELSQALGGSDKKIRQQLKIAVNAVSRKVKSQIAKEIGRELATPQKNIKPTIAIAQKATATRNPTAIVRQSKTKRIPLRDFGAKQNKTGTSYKTSKRKGRKHIARAFQGPRPGVVSTKTRGRVFKRKGKARLPIVQLFGPSPWGVFIKNGIKKPVVIIARGELLKQIQRRTRFIKLKQSGAI